VATTAREMPKRVSRTAADRMLAPGVLFPFQGCPQWLMSGSQSGVRALMALLLGDLITWVIARRDVGHTHRTVA
jgi:hypothetical protein